MKLKEIPNNTVVHTTTEAEAKELLAILHENGYEWKSGDDLSVYSYANNKEAIGLRENKKVVTYIYLSTAINEGKSILTLSEFKSKYCEEEQPQPKFKVGDRVKVVGYQESCITMMRPHVGEVGTITATNKDSNYYEITCDDGFFSWREDWLEPYSEPETKPNEDMKIKENRNLSQDVANCDKSEGKELNLCELLAGHEGESIFLTALGNAIIRGVSERSVQFNTHETAKDLYSLPSNGKMNENGLVIAFPSRDIYEQYPLDPKKCWEIWAQSHQYKKRIKQLEKVIADARIELDTLRHKIR